METKKILSSIGTLVIIGAVSTAGAALWTNVLDDKIKMVKAKNPFGYPAHSLTPSVWRPLT